VDRGTRRLFVVALVVLVAVVGLATIILSAPPTGDAPPGTSSVEGVIVAVDSSSLSDVRSFDLRTSDGSVRRFGLAALENGTEFPPGHLVEHSATAEPVRVWYRTEGGLDLAIRLEDAGPAGGTGAAGAS
jgi:hypothetical protein